MPDSKLDLKNLGTVRLMEIDTSTLFLPYGRPITDYLLGAAGNQNGTRALLKQGAIDFSPAILWSDFTASRLRTTGFGELEREGLIPSAPAPAEPAVADFLPFERPQVLSKDSNRPRISPAIAPKSPLVSLPRISALPLRSRMTFGPPPAAKAKPVAAPPAPKPVAAPPKPAPVLAPKPSAPAPPPKATAAPAPVQAKPVTVIPPAPKPSAPPAPKPAAPPSSPKVTVPAAPAARTAESMPAAAPPAPKPAPTPAPAQPKTSIAPAKAPVSPARTQEAAVSTLEAPTPVRPVAVPPVASKAPTAAPSSPKASSPPVSSGRPPAGISIVESAPAARTRPEADTPAPKPPARLYEAPALTNEPHLSMGDDAESRSFLEKVPLPAKIGIAILVLLLALYFVLGKSDKSTAARGTVVGEQGWSTEWASDAGGSRRGRQITLYRPSTGLGDYQMQFTGQIESKALGWVFRAADTKNYYAMKLENLRPGVMAISHFAVVEGRESSNSQRPLTIDARPGAVYRVKLDVNGPRFTISIGGEPVDFWTDNRLKSGAVGFMNERDERGATSSVQFSFPQGVK